MTALEGNVARKGTASSKHSLWPVVLLTSLIQGFTILLKGFVNFGAPYYVRRIDLCGKLHVSQFVDKIVPGNVRILQHAFKKLLKPS
jgi:hypothetical protein